MIFYYYTYFLLALLGTSIRATQSVLMHQPSPSLQLFSMRASTAYTVSNGSLAQWCTYQAKRWAKPVLYSVAGAAGIYGLYRLLCNFTMQPGAEAPIRRPLHEVQINHGTAAYYTGREHYTQINPDTPIASHIASHRTVARKYLLSETDEKTHVAHRSFNPDASASKQKQQPSFIETCLEAHLPGEGNVPLIRQLIMTYASQWHKLTSTMLPFNFVKATHLTMPAIIHAYFVPDYYTRQLFVYKKDDSIADICLYNAITGKSAAVIPIPPQYTVEHVAITEQGKITAIIFDRKQSNAYLITDAGRETEQKVHIAEAHKHTGSLTACLSMYGKYACIGENRIETDGIRRLHPRVYNVMTNEWVCPHLAKDTYVEATLGYRCFSDNETLLALPGDTEKSLTIWDLLRGEKISSITKDDVIELSSFVLGDKAILITFGNLTKKDTLTTDINDIATTDLLARIDTDAGILHWQWVAPSHQLAMWKLLNRGSVGRGTSITMYDPVNAKTTAISKEPQESIMPATPTKSLRSSFVADNGSIFSIDVRRPGANILVTKYALEPYEEHEFE